ncbi:MAG: hypothetical protein Q7S27_06775 [Nanoarchaeota archaeon]|nr:hypothetical protein [Nanoarchaeota archaeon]
MEFEKKKENNIGEYIGYFVMYFIFTTIFYFVLRALDKIPEGWNYLYIMTATLLIVLAAKLLGMYLQ